MGGVVNCRDSSGNGYHGSSPTNITYVRDDMATEQAASFEFDEGYFSIGDVAALELTTAYSVEFWIKKNGVPAFTQYLVSKYNHSTGDGWRVTLGTNGTIGFRHTVPTTFTAAWAISSAAVVTDNLPHHVVCSWVGNTEATGVRIYVDGVLSTSTAATTATLATGPSAGAFVGAAHNSPPENYFSGRLADVAVYDSYFPIEDVLEHYEAGLWTAILLISSGLKAST